MSAINPLRFRQIHLDFHTSEKIPDVGSHFDSGQFKKMLQLGHVDSITIFSKCHHGLSYHQTKVGCRHPYLTTELLPEQIQACREIDVKTPIYISAGFDEHTAGLHPEWCWKGREGDSFHPLEASWKTMCFNTPYLDYLCAQIEEVIDLFGASDGIFLDIISARSCYCKWCMQGMADAGIDPKDEAQVSAYGYQVLQKYYERTTAASKKGNPARKVFHNSGHISKGAPQTFKWNSHLELESLPTGGWGYDHFPLSAKYAATTGYQVLGMTGKFHTTWGEFGGFKRKNALRYECAAMLAFGAKCSVGDQLHPSGEMNKDTYELIGAAYSEVESKEPWCKDAYPLSEIALISSEALHADQPGGPGRTNHSEEGAARMLLELHHQFDVVDLDHDISSYRLIILPDEITLQGAFLKKIQDYVAKGGKLLISGMSGMTPAKDAFALNLGITIEGRGICDPDYIVPTDLAPTSPVRGPFVIHGGAWNVIVTDEAVKTLATRSDTYFNREWNHFCSHQHTPDSTNSKYPAAVIDPDKFAWFAHDIFTRYRLYGQPLYRDMVQDAISGLIGQPVVETNLPTAARVSLMRQDYPARTVLHLLFAVPVKRGADQGSWFERQQSVEVIEDLYDLANIQCSLKVTGDVKSVRLVPSGQELSFQLNDGRIDFTIPHLLCHQMVEIV